jgi:uncharacterized membrane protein YjgN (DUF898 family)
MRVPTIDRGPGAASPWGRPRPPEEAIRLEPIEAPLSGIVIKGTLLTFMTLGIYRFWYRVNLRRYYWSNTTLLGDGFEYTGTGRELLVGFLIMLAIFVPINFAASLVGLFAGEVVGSVISAFAAALILPALIQIFIYRARGYRLSRTRYRGIRFHQTGTGTAFLVTTAKWLLLTALSFGIVMPYLREAMHRYKISNTHFGSLNASCGSNPKALMAKWLPVWGVMILTLLVGGSVAVFFALAAIGGSIAGSAAVGSGLAFILFAGIPLAGMLVVAILWQVYRVHEFRHFVSTTRFGELALSSDASAKTVIWITVKFLAMLVAFGIGLVVMAGIIGGVEALSDIASDESEALGGLLLLIALGFVALIGYALIKEIYLSRKLWQHYSGSIALTNTSQLASIIQSQGLEGSALGDSFDPGFDIGG